MSEFDKLKDNAEQYAREHPEQVQKAEQAVEDKLGIGGEQGQEDQPGGDQEQGGQQGEDNPQQ